MNLNNQFIYDDFTTRYFRYNKKKISHHVNIWALYLLFSSIIVTFPIKSIAQVYHEKSDTVGDNIKNITTKPLDVISLGLQLGEYVPSQFWNSSFNTYQKGSVKLNFLKGKWIILDFWATWCSPCVAMMPKIQELQTEFGRDVTFVSVTYQSEQEVKSIFERKSNESSILKIINDTLLHGFFPHHVLPHFVWINPEGQISAITGGNEINASSIKQAIAHGKIKERTKKDFVIEYQKSKPLLIDGNGGDGKGLIGHSLLTSYVEGLDPGSSFQKSENGSLKITIRNGSIRKLYGLAFGAMETYYGKNRLVLRVADTSALYSAATGDQYREWAREHTYCYELILPNTTDKDFFMTFRRDMENYFPQYKADIKLRKITCLVLTKIIGATDRNLSQNAPNMNVSQETGELLVQSMLPNHIVYNLNLFFMQNSAYPVIDGTDHKSQIDLNFGNDLSDLEKMNLSLKIYGFKLEKKKVKIPILEISDNGL